MLKALANENAEDDRATAIRDTLLTTRKFLIEHPEECKVAGTQRQAPSKFARKDDQHTHGSSTCICHFLSDRTWSERKVREYLGIAADVAEHVANDGSTHPERQDTPVWYDLFYGKENSSLGRARRAYNRGNSG
jgi:hypothetical protein